MATQQQLIFTNDVARSLSELVEKIGAPDIFVITDEIVQSHVMEPFGLLPTAKRIVIEPGDTNKTIEAVCRIWDALVQGRATRHSLVVNIGGGMVTDIGAFAASTFKRGVGFINVPTTLLGAVDAAVGGKTGFNYHELKNEIGVFSNAMAVVISTIFFHTLSQSELRSGFAEMIKHSLIDSPESYAEILQHDLNNLDTLLPLLQRSVMVKKRIVTEDPTERGLRKALNLGHTAGHAFESLAMRKEAPVPHGYAVAWGMVVELILATMLTGFPSAELSRFAAFIRNLYGSPSIGCDDYPALIELMSHDKKNQTQGEINFSLPQAPGSIELDCTASTQAITEALDLYRDFI